MYAHLKLFEEQQKRSFHEHRNTAVITCLYRNERVQLCWRAAESCLSYTSLHRASVCIKGMHTKHIEDTHAQKESSIIGNPSLKKTSVLASHIFSISVPCQKKAANEPGWECQGLTALTCLQSSCLTRRVVVNITIFQNQNRKESDSPKIIRELQCLRFLLRCMIRTTEVM